jgi:hypothetical protein
MGMAVGPILGSFLDHIGGDTLVFSVLDAIFLALALSLAGVRYRTIKHSK